MAGRRLSRRYAPQAKDAAYLRYNPEKRGIRALLLQAAEERDRAVHAAHATGRGMRQTVRATRGPLRDVYADASRDLRSNQGAFSEAVGTPGSGSVNANLARLGPGAGSIVASALAEQAGSRDRVSEAGAQAMGDLNAQLVDSRAGEGFAVRAANQQFGADAGKLLDQLQGVRKEQGVFTAAELDRLIEGARGRRVTRRGQDVTRANSRRSQAQSERNSQRSSGVDPDTGRPIKGGKLDKDADGKVDKPGEKGPSLTTNEENRAIDAITEARSWIQKLSTSAHMTPEQIRDALVQGDTLTDAAGNEQKVPKIPDVYVTAGFDLFRNKRLDHGTQRALHRRGVHVPRSWRWRKYSPPASSRPDAAQP